MTTLKVTARGQVTFRKEVFRHLGIRPGDRIRLDLLPNAQASLSAESPAGSWDEVYGFLDDKTNGARLSIAEINDAIEEAGLAKDEDLRTSSPTRTCFFVSWSATMSTSGPSQ